MTYKMQTMLLCLLLLQAGEQGRGMLDQSAAAAVVAPAWAMSWP
jgi:hypothetical protein